MVLHLDETVKFCAMEVSKDTSISKVNEEVGKLVVVMATQLQALLSILYCNAVTSRKFHAVSLQEMSFMIKTQLMFGLTPIDFILRRRNKIVFPTRLVGFDKLLDIMLYSCYNRGLLVHCYIFLILTFLLI